MDIDTALLRRTGLFQDMEDGDIRRLLDCLHCPVRRYGRGEFLWHAGDAVPMAGIVLAHCILHIFGLPRIDRWRHRRLPKTGKEYFTAIGRRRKDISYLRSLITI